MKRERYEDRRDEFEAAIAINPKFLQAIANLGVALKQLGKLSKNVLARPKRSIRTM